MKAFTFVRPASVAEAASEAAKPASVVKAGGTDLLDRMKERVDEPDRVVWLGDVQEAAMRKIVADGESLRIGSMVTLAELAESEHVTRAAPALAESAAQAASQQIRARATLGGNLLQHTRCGYYRIRSFACWKRGDAECPALAEGGEQENAAVFGNRPCASAHPSSIAPVLASLDATVFVSAPGGGSMESNLGAFYLPYHLGMTKGARSETLVPVGGIVTHVVVPSQGGRRAAYEEIRQRAAFDWALASCCARVDLDGAKVKHASIHLGSVAPIPWQAKAAEKALVGKTLDDATIRAASDAAADGATPLPGNAYKVDLVKVCVRRALERLRAAK